MCSYTRVPVEAAVLIALTQNSDPSGLLGPHQDVSGVRQDGSQVAYFKDCQGGSVAGGGFVPGSGTFVFGPVGGAGPVAPPPPSPGELAQQAAQQTPLPAPAVELSPRPPIPLLVTMPTFLWIDPGQWVPVTASASAAGVTSTVTATPSRVVWDMGNGESVSCAGPGAAYSPALPDDQQPSDCKYSYPRSSAGARSQTFTLKATLEFDVTWVAVGAPGGGSLGTARRSTTTPVQVAEIQVLNGPVR